LDENGRRAAWYWNSSGAIFEESIVGMKYSVLLFFSLILIQFPATAQVRCADLFSNAGDWVQLDPKSVATKGFSLTAEGNLYEQSSNLFLGKIRTLRTKYLFEWASRSESQTWIKSHGIHYMKDILAEGGQAAGKGYYVSLNPFDSANYGDTMTAFRQSAPITVLEAPYGSNSQIRLSNDTDLVQRLSEAGVDAIRHTGYTATWISVISERNLQNASGFPVDVARVNYDLKNSITTSNFVLYSSQIPVKVLRQLPTENLLRRFLLVEKITLEELKTFREKPVWSTQTWVQSLLVKHIDRLLNSADTLPKLQALIDSVPTSEKVENFKQLQKGISRTSRKSNREIQYLNILDLYDFKEVALAQTPLSTMRLEAAKVDQNRQNTELYQIAKGEDLKKAVETIYGIQLKWRQSPAYVALQGDAPTKLSLDAYQALSSQKVMSVQESGLSVGKNIPRDVKFQYLNFDRADLFLRNLPQDLKDKLQQARLALMASSGNWDTPGVRPVFAEVLAQLTTQILTSPMGTMPSGAFDGRRIPLLLYKLFLRIRPFESGNELAAQVFYDLTSRRMSNDNSLNRLGVAAKELDLFVDEISEVQYQLQVQLLTSWIAKGKDDAEFTRRSRWALEVLLRIHSELRPLLPQLKSINDLGEEIP
jgi:hypothetical protein